MERIEMRVEPVPRFRGLRRAPQLSPLMHDAGDQDVSWLAQRPTRGIAGVPHRYHVGGVARVDIVRQAALDRAAHEVIGARQQLCVQQ